MRALAVLLTVGVAVVSAACSPSGSGSGSGAAPATTPSSGLASMSPGTPGASTAPSAGTPTTATPSTGATAATTAAGPGTGALRGAVIVIDPGHNGGNASHPAQINRQVNVVTGYKACNTTGTETNAHYAEHAFTWDLAARLASTLRAEGARVVLTRPDDTGVGPCVNQRAAIGNREHADLVLSLHADGSVGGGPGFHIILPGPVGPNDAIVAPSRRLGTQVRDAFHAGTGEPYATYTGRQGLTTRTDLGGLNLSTVPAVFIECGNMRDPGDAQRLSSSTWRQRAAQALATGMAAYLSAR